VFVLFSKKQNREWAATGIANSPLAQYLDVDFEIVEAEYVLDERYREKFSSGRIPPEEMNDLIRERNNIVLEIRMTMVVIKS
jgi:hypothetical protein